MDHGCLEGELGASKVVLRSDEERQVPQKGRAKHYRRDSVRQGGLAYAASVWTRLGPCSFRQQRSLSLSAQLGPIFLGNTSHRKGY